MLQPDWRYVDRLLTSDLADFSVMNEHGYNHLALSSHFLLILIITSYLPFFYKTPRNNVVFSCQLSCGIHRNMQPFSLPGCQIPTLCHSRRPSIPFSVSMSRTKLFINYNVNPSAATVNTQGKCCGDVV